MIGLIWKLLSQLSIPFWTEANNCSPQANIWHTFVSILFCCDRVNENLNQKKKVLKSNEELNHSLFK